MTIGALELQRLRDEAETWMTSVVRIKRPARVNDGKGGQTTTYPVIETTIGRISRTSGGREGRIGDRLIAEVSTALTLPAGTDIRAADRAEVDGRDFEVTEVPPPPTIEITRKAALKETK